MYSPLQTDYCHLKSCSHLTSRKLSDVAEIHSQYHTHAQWSEPFKSSYGNYRYAVSFCCWLLFVWKCFPCVPKTTELGSGAGRPDFTLQICLWRAFNVFKQSSLGTRVLGEIASQSPVETLTPFSRVFRQRDLE